MGSSSCCSVGKHHGLVVEFSLNSKPVECAKEGRALRELGKVENQGFDGTRREPSQQRVAVVQTVQDKTRD